VIAYLDSSVLARAYLVDEDGHREAAGLLADPRIAPVTGTWTRIEVSGALVRAARAGRGDEKGLLALLDADLAGPVIVSARRRNRSSMTRWSSSASTVIGATRAAMAAALTPKARCCGPRASEDQAVILWPGDVFRRGGLTRWLPSLSDRPFFGSRRRFLEGRQWR
jgi:hypothetical protein